MWQLDTDLIYMISTCLLILISGVTHTGKSTLAEFLETNIKDEEYDEKSLQDLVDVLSRPKKHWIAREPRKHEAKAGKKVIKLSTDSILEVMKNYIGKEDSSKGNPYTYSIEDESILYTPSH